MPRRFPVRRATKHQTHRKVLFRACHLASWRFPCRTLCVTRAGSAAQERSERAIRRRLHAVVGRTLLIRANVPVAYLLHLLLGAEVNGPETFSATAIEAQMQVAWMLQ